MCLRLGNVSQETRLVLPDEGLSHMMTRNWSFWSSDRGLLLAGQSTPFILIVFVLLVSLSVLCRYIMITHPWLSHYISPWLTIIFPMADSMSSLQWLPHCDRSFVSSLLFIYYSAFLIKYPHCLLPKNVFQAVSNPRPSRRVP